MYMDYCLLFKVRDLKRVPKITNIIIDGKSPGERSKKREEKDWLKDECSKDFR